MKKILLFLIFCLTPPKLYSQIPDSSILNRADSLALRVGALEARVDSLRNELLQASQLFELYVPDTIIFCGRLVPINQPHVRERIRESLRALVGSRNMHQRMQSALELGSYYLPIIDSVFAARGRCGDYRYIAVIESHFNPNALSRAGARGQWQIMGNTGRECGLHISRLFDERKNFIRALDCADRHLRSSENLFHDPYWASVAYNAGDGGTRRVIEENNNAEFFEAVIFKKNGALNYENFNYVYNEIAAKLIFDHPERYGFPRDIMTEFDLQNIELEVPRLGILLTTAARRLNMTAAQFVFWNPEFSTRTIPMGKYLVTVLRRVS